MSENTPDVIPSIRTLPLPEEFKPLFSRVVRLLKQAPGAFASVGTWLNQHYSAVTLRKLCERKYRQEFAYRLRLLRRNGTGNFALSTYKRRLALQEGCPREKLMQETIDEARFRGYRLNGREYVCRTNRDQYPDEKVINQENVYLVWADEDARYRRRFHEIKAERKAAKLHDHDHPEDPGWRLARAVGEIVEADYPDPPDHVEHSRRIVAIAGLLVCADLLPTLAEMGRWAWQSEADTTWEANPADPNDDFWRALSQPPVQNGPHKMPLHMLHARFKGREEVLFYRKPGEPRKLNEQLCDFVRFCEQLDVAVDELEDELRAKPLLDSNNKHEYTHSADFTDVNWFGTQYHFDDGQQAKAVGALWSEFEKGELGLSEKTIGEIIGSESDNFRLMLVFRSRAKCKSKREKQAKFSMHPAWGKMIQKVSAGCYRLIKP